MQIFRSLPGACALLALGLSAACGAEQNPAPFSQSGQQPLFVATAPELTDESVSVQTADFDVETDVGAVEQTQFGGFRPRLLNRPSLASATPRRTTRSQPRMRRLVARAPATSRRQRLARAPDMLGDTLQAPFQIVLQPQNPMNGLSVVSQIAPAGGNSRVKISEHNKALPVDRFYVNYNHFHNAVQRQVVAPGEQVIQSQNLDRFTIGAERTLLGGDASVELRLPLSAYPDLDLNFPMLGPAGRFKSSTGSVGNLSLIGKRLLVNAEDLVVACGLGLEFPSGSDGGVLSGTTRFEIQNESLYLQPFAALMLDNGEVFLHSFLQVDMDLTGSPLTVSNSLIPDPPIKAGDIDNATLLHWDSSAGIWLLRSEENRGLTGVAGIVEYHLTSTTSSTPQLFGFVPPAGPIPGGGLQFAAGSNSQKNSLSYITTGVHAEFASKRTCRVAAVFPLVGDLFDTEFVVQFGSRY